MLAPVPEPDEIDEVLVELFYADQEALLEELPSAAEAAEAASEVDAYDPLRRVAGLIREKKDLEARLKRVKAAIEAEAIIALDHMANNGIDRQRVDGVTLFPRNEVYASLAEGKTLDDLLAALTDCGITTGGIVKTSADSRRLSSLAREYDGALPAPLQDVLKVSEVTKLGTRSA